MLKDKSQKISIDNNDIYTIEENDLDIEKKLDLYNAIDCLPVDKKTIIILKYFHGFSIKEMSLMLNMSENTIKSHIRRSKQQLYKILKEDICNE